MLIRTTVIAAVAAGIASSAHAAIIPFTETFDTNAANWTGPAGPATYDPAGNIAAETNVNAASFGVVIALRGQAANNASNGAFIGNWITEGVTALTFSVRHSAPIPMNFGARLVTPFNFPGAIGLDFAPVSPGQWTTVTIPISSAYPGWVSFEGSDFNTIFSNIGSVQLLYNVPDALAGTGTSIRVEADNIAIIPGAGTLALLTPLLPIALRRKR
ncbi:MAG: hypothetical protein JNK58_03490 [Phycisphaerae bacterium]|nr:hypothetical protein [Phycisphaerae bacterium]